MGPTNWLRRPGPVQAWELASLRDLPRAEAWLRTRGAPATSLHPSLGGRGLHLPRRQIARVGDWVLWDPATGRADWASAEEFRLLCDPAVTEGDVMGA